MALKSSLYAENNVAIGGIAKLVLMEIEDLGCEVSESAILAIRKGDELQVIKVHCND